MWRRRWHRISLPRHYPGPVTGAAQVEQAVDREMAVPPDPTAAAFFDVDNTVVRGASIFHLARGLYRRKFFSLRDIARMAWQQLRFRAVGESLDHLQEIRESALSFVAGHSVAELTAIGEEVYDEVIADKIWPGTHALAQLHLEAGQRVWLVTATPVEVADVIARRLGLSGALGTVAESVDGVYTGRLVGEPLHGAGQGRGDHGPGRARGPGPVPVRGVLGLGQRHPDALAGRRTLSRSTQTPPCAPTPRRTGGGSATTAPAARPPRSASRPRPGSARRSVGVFAGLALRRRRQRRSGLAGLRRRRRALTRPDKPERSVDNSGAERRYSPLSPRFALLSALTADRDKMTFEHHRV